MTEQRIGFSRIWLVLCLGLTLMILWLALMPSASAPTGLGRDKLNHVGAIAVASGLAFLSLHSHRWAAPAAFLYGVFLGILIEILQATLTSNRSAEWGDVAADVIGAGGAWLAIRLYQRLIAAKQ
jgi:VanZ family protein